MVKGQPYFYMSSPLKSLLNKKASKICTRECIPHIPIAQFMRVHHINRNQVFRLGKKKYLSLTRVGKRYFVAIPSEYNDIPMWDLLEY